MKALQVSLTIPTKGAYKVASTTAGGQKVSATYDGTLCWRDECMMHDPHILYTDFEKKKEKRIKAWFTVTSEIISSVSQPEAPCVYITLIFR
jgi:hypothetical protein